MTEEINDMIATLEARRIHISQEMKNVEGEARFTLFEEKKSVNEQLDKAYRAFRLAEEAEMIFAQLKGA